VALDGDAEVMRYLTGRARARAEAREEGRPMMSRDAGADGRLGYWAGRPEAGFVGWWCLTPAPDDPGDAELGYRLRRDAWGHGNATEGALALQAHGFDTDGLEHVWAQPMAVNRASRAVMGRVGLVFERTWVGEWNEPLPGWEQGEVAYGLTRQEWRARS
jgi:RimJ/RimL family protein N-acetyltransferase